jgi:cytochrome c556
MILARTIVAGAACAALTVGAAMADGNPAVGARQSQMRLQGFNVGILVAMAQGKMDYDATTAQEAATNLKALTATDWTLYFPPGTAVGEADNTKALPAIWSDMDGFNTAHQNLAKAAASMADVAGNGLDALKGALGAVGGACGGCHKTYRQSDN